LTTVRPGREIPWAVRKENERPLRGGHLPRGHRESAPATSCWKGGAGLGLCGWRFGPGEGRRALPTQRPGAEQGAADDRAAGEDAGGPPEPRVIAVRLRQPGQGLAADDPGRGEVRGDVRGDGGGEDGAQQGGADRGAELLADGDGRGSLSRVLGGHAERAGVDYRRDHQAQADSG